MTSLDTQLYKHNINVKIMQELISGLLNELIEYLTVILEYIDLSIRMARLYALPGPSLIRPLINVIYDLFKKPIQPID